MRYSLRLSPLPETQPVSGTRRQRLVCWALGHDPVVVWPKAHCRRCTRSWGPA